MAFCGWCGKPTEVGDHTVCVSRLNIVDPPRFCAECGRRMIVQVVPTGWTAHCSRHGEVSAAGR
jgi:hypothetical protein